MLRWNCMSSNHNPSPTKEIPRSCIYECRVRHHRLAPRQHKFEYGLFMVCLDLDELDRLNSNLRWFSRNRRNLYEFRDSDHLIHAKGESDNVRSSIQAWLLEQGVPLPKDSRIQLVTLPRVIGYIFNPVSFYFVQSADGIPICALAEVGNTFGELKPFLVPIENYDSGSPSTACFRRIAPKEFYVSPFTDLEVCFDFRFRIPGERLEIGINDVTTEGKTLLISALVGTKRPLTDSNLLRVTLQYPLMTLRVILLIHWEALRLWWKRLPWHRKGDQPERQRGVYRPHSSILPR